MSGRTRKKTRHNAGRKPFYKEKRRYIMGDAAGAPTLEQAAEQLMAHPSFMGGGWLSRGIQWEGQEEARLHILSAANVNIEKAADAIGRSPKALAHRARDIGLQMPAAWSGLISAYRPREKSAPLLCYPYVKKATPDAGDLMRANTLVPKGLPEWMRADVCQSMMLALFEGEVTLDEIETNKAKVRWFIKRFYKEQMPYEEVQLGDSHGDDERPYYDRVGLDDAWQRREMEWRAEETDEYRRAHDSWAKFSPASQIDDIYDVEIALTASFHHSRGTHLSKGEVRMLIDQDEWGGKIGTFASNSLSHHVIKRSKERFGVNITPAQLTEIARRCREKTPHRQTPHADFYDITVNGAKMEAVINGRTGDVMTVLYR